MPPHQFTAVDSQPDPRGSIDCLDRLQGEPFYAAYKARVAELLAPRRGGRYLDVGGGTGDDARRVAGMSGADVVVVDASRAMIEEAARRGIEQAHVGDAVDLPFPSQSFDGCWADRVFQHLADPGAALAELIRVTRSGGRIVVVDPDYDTQVVSTGSQELARRVLGYRADRLLRHGTIAHQMGGRFTAAGLVDVSVEGRTLVVRAHTAVDNVMGLRSWARSGREEGLFTEREVEIWEREIDEAIALGRFLYAVTFFITAGTRP